MDRVLENIRYTRRVWTDRAMSYLRDIKSTLDEAEYDDASLP